MMQPPTASPARAVAPPTKKHRSGRTPGDRITNATDDAIARRRAELRRLQQLRAPTTAGNNSTAAVLAKARQQLGPPATTTNQNGRKPAVPPQGVARVRHSDLFPDAPKLANSPLRTAAPAQVARTLEFTSPPSLDTSRSKSAPPARPPPPPLHEVQKPAEDPTHDSSSRQGAPPTTPYFPNGRTRVERPPPTPYYPKTTEPNETPMSEQRHVPVMSPHPGVETPSNGVSNGSFPMKTNNEPTLVDEPVTTTEQKAETSVDDGKNPITPHRDLLQTMRQCAETPEEKKETTPKSNDMRLVMELKHAMAAKTEALKKVAQLEKELAKQSKRGTTATNSSLLNRLVEIAETKGDTAALAWAREQVGEPTPLPSFSQVGFLSPVSKPSPGSGNLGAALSPLVGGQYLPTKRRVATPHPKRRASSTKTSDFLVEATQAVPYEYTSALATYVVRRPFSETDVVWDSVGVETKDVYNTKVNATEPYSLEILARIQCDGSMMILSGPSTVRHKISDEWKTFTNVEDMGKPLGCVMYIDGEANEKEYWLDAIYEEAVATREAYCSSLLSTASALQDSSMNGTRRQIHPPEQQTSPVEKKRPQTVDACVSTDDLPIGATTTERGMPTTTTEKGMPPPEKPKERQIVEEDSSSDALSVMMPMLIFTIVSLVWFVLVGIPVRIIKFSCFMAISVAVMSALWLYIADDHGAEAMGARIDYISGGML